MIGKLTWKNLWRNRRRTIITMSSVAFAVVLSVLMRSLWTGAFDNLIKNAVGFYHGYIQVHQQGYWDEPVLENSFPYNDSIGNRIRMVQHITEAAPRIQTFVLASSDTVTKGCLLAGTDPQKENTLTGLQQKIVKGSYLNGLDEPAAILAEGLAARLNLGVDDTLVLLGQGFDGSVAAGKFRIKGLAHFGSPELNNGLVFLPLHTAQQLLGAEARITALVLALDDPANLETAQQRVMAVTGAGYEVMNWKEMMPGIENHIRADSRSSYIFTGILYLIISFGIFGTLLMMINERQYEFGMLVAIGMKKSWLGRMLLGETLLITMMGTLCGLLISLPVVILLERHPIRFSGEFAKAYEQFGFEAIFPAAFHTGIFFSQALIVLCLALVLGLYPMWYVSRIDPVKAMRK